MARYGYDGFAISLLMFICRLSFTLCLDNEIINDKKVASARVERIDLSEKNQKECQKLLLDRGFYCKKHENEEVPPEFKDAPYSRKETEL